MPYLVARAVNFVTTALGMCWLTLAAPGLHAFELSSPDLKKNQNITADYYSNNFGCTGKNDSPALLWKNPPQGTRSFAITFYDKDAPTGSGFWHYIAYDVPTTTNSFKHNDLSQGKLPASAKQGNTDIGKPGFFGPCPPIGRQHHYIWTVYALNIDKLPVEENATSALIGFTLWQHTLSKASFMIKAGPRR
jgi:hypothetical protein